VQIRKEDGDLSISISRGTHPMKLKEVLLEGRQGRHRVNNGREERIERKRGWNDEFKRSSRHRKTKRRIND